MQHSLDDLENKDEIFSPILIVVGIFCIGLIIVFIIMCKKQVNLNTAYQGITQGQGIAMQPLGNQSLSLTFHH